MFFEAKHSLSEHEFTISKGKSITFPPHIHRSIEYFLQIDGETEIQIDGKSYVLTAGEAVLIFPFQIHSYRSIRKGKHEIGIFSMDIVPEFKEKVGQSRPTEHRFSCEETDTAAMENRFMKKSHAYKICGLFDRQREYITDKNGVQDDVILRLLLFAEEHYSEVCAFREAASFVGYDYAYASKLFKRRIGIPFRKYVNLLRISKSLQLLERTSDSITAISGACGFQTARNFNREFLDIVGMQPTEYRKSKRTGKSALAEK